MYTKNTEKINASPQKWNQIAKALETTRAI